MLAITPKVEGVPSPSRMRRVLVIEPYASGRRALCMCIVELGHEVLEAMGAEDARAMATSSTVDMIIASCDDDASRSLLEELHKKDLGLPTVMLSTSAECAVRVPERAMLLIKPFTLEALEQAIVLMPRPSRALIG